MGYVDRCIAFANCLHMKLAASLMLGVFGCACCALLDGVAPWSLVIQVAIQPYDDVFAGVAEAGATEGAKVWVDPASCNLAIFNVRCFVVFFVFVFFFSMWLLPWNNVTRHQTAPLPPRLLHRPHTYCWHRAALWCCALW